MSNQPKLSLLIPFTSTNEVRIKSFEWVKKYFQNGLPDSEIVIGECKDELFCKGQALNDAASRATGKVFVILDSDTYTSCEVLDKCADKILDELDNRLWYVPYRKLYRLTESATNQILDSDPTNPLRLPSPPPRELVIDFDKSAYGHRYGAMVTMFPRQAYDILGCFDERFKGWGGEDVSLLRAIDTLYGKHKTVTNDVLHLWHPVVGDTYETRAWENQKIAHANDPLSTRYHHATRNPTKMRNLVDEGCNSKIAP